MRKSLLIFAFLISISSLLISLSDFYNLTYIPVIIGLILGCVVYYLGRNHQYPKKPIQMIFMIAIIAISVAIFRSVYYDIPSESTGTTEVNVQTI